MGAFFQPPVQTLGAVHAVRTRCRVALLTGEFCLLVVPLSPYHSCASSISFVLTICETSLSRCVSSSSFHFSRSSCTRSHNASRQTAKSFPLMAASLALSSPAHPAAHRRYAAHRTARIQPVAMRKKAIRKMNVSPTDCARTETHRMA
jgi:hypothetical protein